MTLLAVRYVHLLAAATWLCGLVVVGPILLALRRAGAGSDALRAAARAFARVSWTAMAVAIATGLLQVHLLGIPWTLGRLHAKIALVASVCLFAGLHHATARHTTERTRGVGQVALLVGSLAVLGAAVAL